MPQDTLLLTLGLQHGHNGLQGTKWLVSTVPSGQTSIIVFTDICQAAGTSSYSLHELRAIITCLGACLLYTSPSPRD